MDTHVSQLMGEILIKIVKTDDTITFTTSNGDVYRMYHSQDCCESVNIDDIVGDLDDLLNSPILKALEVTNSDNPKEEYEAESYTWTFYHFATLKGFVTIRWYGESNGYYSESVDFVKIN